MGAEVAVSIIVPVYNDASYVEAALESALGQTLEAIEVICVDDASTDGTREIIERMAARDARLKPIFHTENQSASQARKDGVAASRGAYVMFLDGDDELVPHACETAHAAIERLGTDMVQFGTEVVNCANLPEARIRANERMLAPHPGRIEADGPDGLVTACWREHRFGFSLWNKIVRGELCRAAFARIEDGAFPKAQDLYAFFVLAWHARSYAGMGAPLYRYCFGRGVTGGRLSLAAFDVLLTERRVVAALRRFAAAEGASEWLSDVLDGIERSLLLECATKWARDLAAGGHAAGFERLVETWGREEVVCALAERFWWRSSDVARRLVGAPGLQRAPRPTGTRLTIAYYYRSISNGGAQRVAAELCSRWAGLLDEAGEPLYRAVLITDEPAAEGDGSDGRSSETTSSAVSEYPLAAGVARAWLPAWKRSAGRAYAARFRAWQRILDEQGIDVVVYGQWVDACSFWDLLSVKGHASCPAFVLHCHNFTARPYRLEGDAAARLMHLYQICDGAVVLSECDAAYVGRFNGNARFIPNPLDRPAARGSAPVEREPQSIVWVGRISEEKQPLDAVRMMARVVREVPEARLYLVGTGDEELRARLEDEVARLGLERAIELVGFTLEVDAWYRRGSIFVCTSSYEGFPMVIGEALAHGLPVVMYDLPWLAYVRDGRGIRTVPQGREDLLAREVVELLRDPAARTALGNEGRALADDLTQVDICSAWREVFCAAVGARESGGAGELAEPSDGSFIDGRRSDERILFEYITEYQDRVRSDFRDRLSAAERRAAALERASGLVNEVTARIDVRNLGADGNGVAVLWSSDARARVRDMAWFSSGGGGCSIESAEGELEASLLCQGAGHVEFALRGRDVRGEDGARIPFWIDYTAFEVDGCALLQRSRAVWHDRPYRFGMDVAAGQVMAVRIAWRPHAEAEREAGLEAERARHAAEIEAIHASHTWRAGRIVTWPARAFKRLLKRLRGRG